MSTGPARRGILCFSSFSALSARRRGAARLAAAALVSGLVAAGAMAAAGTAVADETPQNQGGATATIGGLKTYGSAVIHDNGEDQQVSAGLFEMSVDNGGTLQTYCIDLHNPTQKDAKYQETPWSGTSLNGNADAGKIRWILQNSYPQVNDLAALAAKAGASGLTEQDAAAGTQVAIWRYSDGADVDAVDPQAEKLADYLEKSAQNLAEPAGLADPRPVRGLRSRRREARPGHGAHQRGQRDGDAARGRRHQRGAGSSTRTARRSPPRPTAAGCTSTCRRTARTVRPR